MARLWASPEYLLMKDVGRARSGVDPFPFSGEVHALPNGKLT